jgi:DMSO/TMAO reductase YedYZ heme-binding membrane subunit
VGSPYLLILFLITHGHFELVHDFRTHFCFWILSSTIDASYGMIGILLLIRLVLSSNKAQSICGITVVAHSIFYNTRAF